MSRRDITASLFRVGSSRKDGVLWQMGAFGRGGLTVLPNCYGLVIVSSEDDGDVGEVVISVVRWQRIGNRQTETAIYQVTSAWETEGDTAYPHTVPKGEIRFDRGTHVAVVGFRAEGIWVSRLGDEHSLDTIVDTRLFESPLPTRLAAPVLGDRGSRLTLLRGLGNRLEQNPRSDRTEGIEKLPFRYGSVTYALPVRFYLFSAGDVGARRRFVAKNHALILNSNGQVHAHWTQAEFRNRTRLTKLADRILVVLDTDPLPIHLRTSLFTADRTELLRNPDAVRLEAELISFINDWGELWDANNEMIRESIRRSNTDRPTFDLSQRVARAMDVRAPGWSRATRSNRPPRPRAPRELFEDPTQLQGPAQVTAARGTTVGIHLSLNAVDHFVPRHAKLDITISHLDIDPESDITMGDLRNGRLRVSVAVPADAELTEAQLDVTVPQWLSPTGVLRGPLSTSITLNIVEPGESKHQRPQKKKTKAGGGDVAPVAVMWTSHLQESEWTAATVGTVESVEASVIGETGLEYASYRSLASDVQLIKLNEEFAPLKAYAAMRARIVGDEGIARSKERYALGVAVDMLNADRSIRRYRDRGGHLDSAILAEMTNAAARGVLAVLPDYDKLTAEVGLGDL